jgi:prolycopene isomerase
MAPPGGQVVIIQKVTDINYAAITDWPAHKAALERYVLDNLERLIPGVSQKMVVKLSASAATSYRYTLNYQGAMLGWEMSPDQLGANRPGSSGPLKNLFFVGHWTQPGGGITPVIVSAMQVAEKIAPRSGKGLVPESGEVLAANGSSWRGEATFPSRSVFQDRMFV